MKLELDHIYNMDCLEGMKAIPDGSVDAIICDLPYGTTACAWDSVIPFEPLWEQYKRVCKPNAAIVLFGSEPFSTMTRMSNFKWFKYDWIWKKSQGADFVHAKTRPLKNYEIISVFYKEQCIYNPQGLRKCSKVKSNDKKFGTNVQEWNHSDSYIQEYENYPLAVIEFKNPTGLEKFHPTQKPLSLLRYLVLTYTNEGG